jgi:hypothetical protein
VQQERRKKVLNAFLKSSRVQEAILSSGGVRAVLSARANELVRLSMVHLLSGAVPLYVINEFPKSGGTWVGQMLGRALGVPFPRNRFPVLRPSIMHGHYLSPFGIKNAVAVWRDGRDVMVSWYHQQLLPHEHRNDAQVERTRREVSFKDYENVYENLPAFIEYAFTKPHSPSFSWTDFVHRWHQLNNVVHVRYEDVRRDAPGELRRVVRELTGTNLDREAATAIADEFSFERQSRRRSGEEDKKSFLRKGVVGDWKEQFSQEAREVFDRHAGRELILLGYEKNHEWVNREK